VRNLFLVPTSYSVTISEDDAQTLTLRVAVPTLFASLHSRCGY